MTRFAMLAAVAVLQGCFSYTPLETGVPTVGENIEFQINDRGRFELADRLGRGLATVEGRVTAVTETQYTINVAAISYLSGEKNRWSGESLRLERAHVDRAAVRALSRRRSWIAAGLVAAGLVLFIATRGLLVDFFGETDNPPTVEPPISLVPQPDPSMTLTSMYAHSASAVEVFVQ